MMEFKYGLDHDRTEIKILFEKFAGENKKIITIGSELMVDKDNSWIKTKSFATVDLFDTDNTDKLHFKGNISLFYVWMDLLNYVNKHGKFDFCYCSHTIEDISNPKMVCDLMPMIANSGLVSVPSKFVECKRGVEGEYRGYCHHRWIFNVENNNFISYPKLNFVEYCDFLDGVSEKYKQNNAELQIFWESNLELNIINNDFLGPTTKDIKNYYLNLLTGYE